MKIYIRAAIKDVLDEDSRVLERIARDPRTRPEVLDKIARSRIKTAEDHQWNPYLLLDLLDNPKISTDTLNYLYPIVSRTGGMADGYVPMIARHPNVSNALIHKLANDPNIRVVFAVLNNPNVPSDILENLVATTKDDRILREIAGLPTTSPDLLRKLAKMTRRDVAYVVAENPNTPKDVIDYYATDPDADSLGRGAIASDPKSSPELLTKVYNTEPDYYIGMRLLTNPNTPDWIICELATKNSEIARSLASKKIKPEILKLLLQLDDSEILRSLARNTTTPVSALVNFANDADYKIRQAVASNPNLPIASMQKLAKDKTKAVRYALVLNDAVPGDVLETLTNDKDIEIRSIAEMILGR